MGLSNDGQIDLNSKVYNSLSDIAFEYHQKGIKLSEDEMKKAFEWFTVHFYGDNHMEYFEESTKIKEMGMRPSTTSFDVKHINKLLGIINAEMSQNFGKEALNSEIKYDEKPGQQDTCVITFNHTLMDANGKYYDSEAEKYLRGAKINLSKISGDPEALSALASIRDCLDYDNATFINAQEVALVNPEVVSFNVQLVAPANSNTGKPRIAQEEVYYGIFSDTGYGPRSSAIVTKIKRRILQDCYECISNPGHEIYRDNGSIYGIFDNREEAANAIRSRREHEAYSSQYSRGYYRTAYIVAKCNKEGEFIMSLKDFYDPSLWDKYPTEDEIKECIKAYNASILNRGANN